MLLRWDAGTLTRVAAQHPRAIHLMTNARALDRLGAYARTLDAAHAVRGALPDSRIVLRGDSTLRGHVLEEYRAVCDGAFRGRSPVLLLVPALPAAGRVTRDGVQWAAGPDGPVALHQTEYACDGDFAYSSARLLDWAHDRSNGAINAERGTEVRLGVVRADGADAVADAIRRAHVRAGPTACVPDAETVDDLRIIADGLRQAEAAGVEVIVRCAPTFAGVLAGTLAEIPIAPPRTRKRGLLVVCGSYVSLTSRQLAHLQRESGVEVLEVDVVALLGEDPDAEVRRVAGRARTQLRRDGLSVVSTPRERLLGATSIEAGLRVADGLARVVAALRSEVDVVIAKGGITSQVVLERGLGAIQARVVGPIRSGVALWQVPVDGREISYLVCPGNVGETDLLSDVVGAVHGARP